MTSTQDNKKAEQIREQKDAAEIQAEQLKAAPEAGDPEKARGDAAKLTPAGEIRKKAAENNFFSLPWDTPGANSREHQKIIEQLNAAGDELIKANSAAAAAGAIDKSNNIIDSTKQKEIERLAAATNKYNDLWARAILTDDKETILLFYSQLLLNNPIYGDHKAIKKMLDTINEHLKPGQLDALQAEAEKMKATLIEAGKIQQRAEAVKEFLAEELQKEKYNGATFYDLITARDPADLADPDDEKTKLLMDALAAAERAEKRTHKRGTYFTETKLQQEEKQSGKIPERLAVISKKGYTNALDYKSLFKAPEKTQFDAAGHIISAKRIETSYDEQGNLFILTDDKDAEEASKIKLTTAKSHEVIESINKQNLDLFFSIISYNIIQEQINQGATIINPAISIDAYELAESLGTSRNKGKQAINNAISATQEFQNIVGILQNSTAKRPSEFAVLQFKKYDEKTNEITIESPYIVYLIKRIFKESYRRTETGEIEKSTTGRLLTDPMFSYLIHSDIIKERDKAAIENVKIITVLIEQAGSFTPHISARELIDRNSYLSFRLEKEQATKEKNRILKRVFVNTWKYLKTDTDILKEYDKIKIPEIWPTVQNLEYVFEFPNSGKSHAPRR